MTTDITQPQSELGPASDNGQVQSQGHRRRRRRRKNKSGQQTAQQPQQPQMQQQPLQPKPAHQHPQQHQHPHQHQGRKKKKFFPKSQTQPSQPGNSIAQGAGAAKRKGKQKGPREFVGPMDHSYRAVNGNVADAPPSTIQFMAGSYNGNYMESHSQQQAAVRHDAPTRIFCFIEDLFLQAKIQENARKLGIKVEFIKGDKDVISRLTDVPEADRPTLLVFDLNNLNAKPLALIPKLKTKLKKATSIVGFLHHLQGDLKMKALEAGCDTVMPRSAFSQTLPNLLRRYGIADEEEDYVQQPM